MSTACLSDFRIESPALLVDSTACGCCVQWLQHLYSLDLIGSAHGSPPRLQAYGVQASMIELGSSICAELHY